MHCARSHTPPHALYRSARLCFSCCSDGNASMHPPTCPVNLQMPLQGPGDSQAAAPAGVAEAAGAAPDPFATASHFRLRWFTPTCEVPCCGHATVASAAVLYQGGKGPVRVLSLLPKQARCYLQPTRS